MEQLFVDNLKLLGYASKTQNPFKIPNIREYEQILYFLFNKLDPARTRIHFKECWPIQQPNQREKYYTTLLLWLNELNLFENNETLKKSSLKSMNEAKFYKYMWALSKHVLKKSIKDVPFDHHVDVSDKTVYIINLHLKQKCSSFLQKIQKFQNKEKDWREYAQSIGLKDPNNNPNNTSHVIPRLPIDKIRKIWIEKILGIEMAIDTRPLLTWHPKNGIPYQLEFVDKIQILNGLQSLQEYLNNHQEQLDKIVSLQ